MSHSEKAGARARHAGFLLLGTCLQEMVLHSRDHRIRIGRICSMHSVALHLPFILPRVCMVPKVRDSEPDLVTVVRGVGSIFAMVRTRCQGYRNDRFTSPCPARVSASSSKHPPPVGSSSPSIDWPWLQRVTTGLRLATFGLGIGCAYGYTF
jgi:hypothetical protein